MVKVSGGTSRGLGGYLKRSMNGTTFTALEMAAHMTVVVIVTGLIAAGTLTALSLWTGESYHSWSGHMMLTLGSGVTALCGLMLSAALLVLSPFVSILERRTSAEVVKRPTYADGHARKVPMYVALAVVWGIMLCSIVTLVWVGLYGLANMSSGDSYASELYQNQFVAALVTLIIFGASGYGLIRLTQGFIRGRTFSTLLTVLGLALAVVLFTSAAADLGASSSKIDDATMPMMNDYMDYDDYIKHDGLYYR